MIFLWLALVGLIFGLLGFLLHAFYFGKQDLIKRLSTEIEGLKTNLAFRERGSVDARQEVAETKALVQSLEKQLAQRNEQMRALQAMAQRREDEIRQLQQAASEIRTSIVQAEERLNAPPEPVVEKPEPAPVPEPAEPKQQKVPLWKDNLNSILDTLNKIERETKK